MSDRPSEILAAVAVIAIAFADMIALLHGWLEFYPLQIIWKNDFAGLYIWAWPIVGVAGLSMVLLAIKGSWLYAVSAGIAAAGHSVIFFPLSLQRGPFDFHEATLYGFLGPVWSVLALVIGCVLLFRLAGHIARLPNSKENCCRSCGYDLHGSPAESTTCPECGAIKKRSCDEKSGEGKESGVF